LSTTTTPTTTSLDLQSLELVSTLRVAPENGPPSSEDYNDGEQEKLIDLTTLVTFINNTLLPILSTLEASASTGIQGQNIYGNLTSSESLYYNSLTSTPLALTDSLEILYGMAQTLQTSQTNLAVQVAALQASLSSSNQNDISLALQGLTSSLNSQQGQINTLQQAVSALQLLAITSMSGVAATPMVAPQSIETIEILWSVAFPTNTYNVSYGIEDPSGFLQVTGFSYLPGGTGVLVRVVNTDTQASHQGTVNAIGQQTQLGSTTSATA
jgi:hypothetical protein